MKNMLIIYPHWPPSNLAGVHRARLISNFLPDFGWHPIVLTVKEIYYEEYGKKRKDIKWFPTIDNEMCKNCKKCISFCPKGVYDVDEDDNVIVKYPYNCIINCNACSYMCCENNAILFPEKKIEKY